MSGLGAHGAQSLSEWLEIATAKLSARARERIRLEIEAHFADGVESHQTDGCSEAEAQEAVLAELGNPVAACKRFRRRHLTEKETRRVEGLLKLTTRTMLFGPVFVVGLFLLFVASTPRQVNFVFGAGVLMCSLIAMFCIYFARRRSSKPDIRLLLLADKLNNVSFTFFLVAFVAWVHWAAIFVLVLIEIIAIIRDLRFWFKLGQIDKVGPQIPRGGAAAS